MKMKGLMLIGFLIIVLSGCGKKVDDFYFEFEDNVQCLENSNDDIRIDSLDFKDEIDKGYLYSYVFDYGQYEYVFRNPDSEYEWNEFMTLGAIGNTFRNEDGRFKITEIPEGFYLFDVTYIYTFICADSSDEEEITLNMGKSFLYYSEKEYTEVEFREAHPDLFE
jgi:hypothetical protein